MIHTAHTVRTLQAVAIIVVAALFIWSTGLPAVIRTASAASITNASDTLSNSAPSVGSNHTIVFTTPNGLTIGQTIQLGFASGFGLGSVVEDDVDILVNGSSSSTAAAAGAGTWGVTISGQNITFTTPTDQGVASSSVITIRVGTNAVTSGTGANQITNPATSSASYPITITGTMQDSGEVRVAIVDPVIVSANVDTQLTFTVSGVNAGQSVNGSPTTTSATTTNSTLPFGNIAVGVSEVLAHDLTVVTNASQGYTVTVQQTGELQSSTGAIIDGFVNGSWTTTPTTWSAPTAVLNQLNTYGHWGLTSDDTSVAARSVQFGSNQWVSGSTTPVAIMGHTGPSDGTGPGFGLARVGYQVQISALQEAGDDYQTTLRYVATPTF
jgi:hypothetical protein